MVHIGEVPDQRPQIFELTPEAEEEYEAGYFGNVLRVEAFDLSSGEENYMSGEREDSLMLWWLDKIAEPGEDTVRMISENFYISNSALRKVEIILDSGADVSSLPLWLRGEGIAAPAQAAGVQDAQGKRTHIAGRRLLSLILFSSDGSPIKIKENVVVANVVDPLIAIGKLLKDGWSIMNISNQLYLTDRSSRIAVHYHRNSLATYAYLQIGQDPRKQEVQADLQYETVRTSVELNSHVATATSREAPGWQNTESLVVVRYSPSQSTFVDPTPVFSTEKFPRRSTVVN